jgi:hypothetical protein
MGAEMNRAQYSLGIVHQTGLVLLLSFFLNDKTCAWGDQEGLYYKASDDRIIAAEKALGNWYAAAE